MNINNINKVESKKEKVVQNNLLDFDFLANEENNTKPEKNPTDLLDFTVKKDSNKKNDFLDLNNLETPKKEEKKIDDYLNLLSKVQNIPITNPNNSNIVNYDFL